MGDHGHRVGPSHGERSGTKGSLREGAGNDSAAARRPVSALFQGPDGRPRTSSITVIAQAHQKVAFRSTEDLSIGQIILVSDGVSCAEAEIRVKAAKGGELPIYRAELRLLSESISARLRKVLSKGTE